MKKVKSGKTIRAFRPKFSVQKKIPFSDPNDAANVDLKAFTESFYKKLCTGSLQIVLDTLTYLKHETNVWFEITTLLIPGENDSKVEIEKKTEWIIKYLGSDIPLHYTAFHPDYKMLDKSPTSIKSLNRAYRIAKKNGLRYVYTGNVHDEKRNSTYCHECNIKLIGRDWHKITERNLKDGKCPHCLTVCRGVFDSKAGNWGSKRLPINLSQINQLSVPVL